MAHSIELLLDEHCDAVIRATWLAMAEAGLPSQLQVKSATNRPHITLLAAQRISPDVDEVLRLLAPRFPLPCVIGPPVVFRGARLTPARLTLARLIVPSAELLALHEDVYRRCLPHLTGAPYAHCVPGHWTAHATLGRRLSAADVGAALALSEGVAPDLAGQIVGLRPWDGDQRIDQLLIG